jgi:hypothetical protein
MKSGLFTFRAWLVASLLAGSVAAAGPLPSLNSSGPYSSMRMLLEKTFLKVDVATIHVRFGSQTQKHLAALAKGKSYSKGLANQIAKVAIHSDDALVQMRFERDVSLDQWMDVVKENLEQARRAGLIDAGLQNHVSHSLPKWFAALSERGYKKADRLMYRVRPNSLRTVVVAANGKVLVDKFDRGKNAARVVLPSYFAPDSDFREPLVRSLFK